MSEVFRLWRCVIDVVGNADGCSVIAEGMNMKRHAVEVALEVE